MAKTGQKRKPHAKKPGGSKPSKNGTTKRMLQQQQLPGVEDEKDPQIHDKAIRYAELRDERINYGKQEKKAKTDLIETMKEHGKTRYHYRELTVDLTNNSDIKVKVQQPGADATDEAPDAEE